MTDFWPGKKDPEGKDTCTVKEAVFANNMHSDCTLAAIKLLEGMKASYMNMRQLENSLSHHYHKIFNDRIAAAITKLKERL